MTSIKDKWSMSDYPSMGWHDCRIYSVSFLNESNIVSFDIDYIFDYKMDEREENRFLVAPANLHLFDAFDFTLEVKSGELVGVTIENMTISYLRKSKNGAVDIFLCVIELDVGKLSVKTSGFEMILRQPPAFSPTQDLGRPV
ncbi:hypothetical protein [Mesorhizobium sp. M0088]|uniref:hypothetical protein n=1 Tax=Mesorhizobium sp. M0088 TaxID=2956873 RepID=UPI00333A71D4